MRILGLCPNCAGEDSIVAGDDRGCRQEAVWHENGAKCEVCGYAWADWLSLVHRDDGASRELVPVRGEATESSVAVWWPADMHRRKASSLIASVLSEALAVRFKLTAATACEGGLSGNVGGAPVELRSEFDRIGLYSVDQESSAATRVLCWYEKLMRILFEYDLAVGSRAYGRGAIVKIAEDDPQYWRKIVTLLIGALERKTGSSSFARAVMSRVRGGGGSPTGARSSGPVWLSDDDIAELCIPGPHLSAF